MGAFQAVDTGCGLLKFDILTMIEVSAVDPMVRQCYIPILSRSTANLVEK
jgi:hypothetical protein